MRRSVEVGLTQSTPLRKKDNLSIGTVALAHSKLPAKEVKINQNPQTPQKKVHLRPHEFMSIACMAAQRIFKEICMTA